MELMAQRGDKSQTNKTGKLSFKALPSIQINTSNARFLSIVFKSLYSVMCLHFYQYGKL